NVAGLLRTNLAAVTTASGQVSDWSPNPNGAVAALAVSENTVYAGGQFTKIGGKDRHHIAALNSTNGIPTAWDPDASGPVLALAVYNSSVYVGGQFSTLGGGFPTNIARLDITTGKTNEDWTLGANASVTVIQPLGNKL